MNDASQIFQPMRVSTLARLLNSTSLGTVISQPKLYRLRNEAGAAIERDGGIDFVKFTAWMRNRRMDNPTRRRRLDRRKTIGHDGSVNKKNVLALLERQEHRCALSGRALTPRQAALDHIIPVSRGGDHRIGNAQVLDKTVNRAKGVLTNDEFIQLCGEVWRKQHKTPVGRTSAQHATGAPTGAELNQGLLFPADNALEDHHGY